MSKPTQSLADPAQVGFAKASNYDRYRPDYTTEETDFLLSTVGVRGHAGASVLDLAAGTGLFTEALAARPEGFRIVAVEPHDDMRGELERKTLPGVQVRKGWGSDIPLESGSLDAVLAAQAFHWFSNLDALKEIHRVLKPGGSLGLIWHIDDYNAPASATTASPWQAKVKELIWETDDSHARFRHDQWRKVFTEDGQDYFAAPLQERLIPFTYYMTKEDIYGRLLTYSQFAVLQGDDLQRFKEKVDAALSASDVDVNEAGEIAVHGNTYTAWTKAL